MLYEHEVDPKARWLYAETYLGEATIERWQEGARKRCRDREVEVIPYERFVNWRRQKNEIAVFTMYAYADIEIPRAFDCVFKVRQPDQHVVLDYIVSQSIYEGWLPLDVIVSGHKHLCILEFENEVPSIFDGLMEEEKYRVVEKSDYALGFCASADLPMIIESRKKQDELRRIHGKDWYKYSDD